MGWTCDLHYYLYVVFVGKLFDKSPLGRLRMRRKDNIKICVILVGCKDVKWVELIRDCFQCLILVLAVQIHRLQLCEK
jgi:hypothetical protein